MRPRIMKVLFIAPAFPILIQTFYPHVLNQRCWVHEMRDIRDEGRVRDRAQLKKMAHAIYQAPDRKAARAAFRRWQTDYPMV
jgi:transposase-like protein